MTCIVAIEHDGHVTLGFDSVGSNGHSRGVRLDAKGWEAKAVNGPRMVFGATTSYRMLQVLRFHAPPPRFGAGTAWARWDGERWLQWMVRDYVPHVREELKDNGLTKVENNVESAGSWLVGIEGGYLFALDSDFQVGRAACRYDAVGSGAMVALGAMSAARELPPHDRLERALLAAEEHACGVGGPFHILSTARES